MRILEVAGSGTVGTVHAGPISSVITRLANGFAACAHEVAVLDGPAAQPRCQLAASVSVREMPAIDARPRIEQTVVALCEAGLFDLVHVHDPSQARAIGKACPVPVVWTAHMLNWTMQPRRSLHPRALIARITDKLAARAARHIVVLNEQTRRALSWDKVSVIPHGIDLASWPPMERAEARRQLGIPATEFRVTCLGRVAPEKGTHVFAEAVALAQAQIPIVADSVGSLSGTFGDSDTVTRYAATVRRGAPNVQFHGFIHRDESEYRQRLAAADAVIVPSITEPFGFVVLEALACGAWVIGSDVGGIRDSLAGRTGELVPAGDAAALARAMVAHHRRVPDPRRAAAARARAAEFEWTHVADEYIELMQRLIGDVKNG